MRLKEVWRNILGYEGLYEISSSGIVKRNGKIRKLCIHRNGYYFVTLYKNNKPKKYYIHRLVYKTFNDEVDMNGLEINHKDGNKGNNNLSNLELVTHQENVLHAYKCLGVRSNAIKVVQYDKKFNKIKTWKSSLEASIALNINQGSISSCCNGKIKHAGGYIWEKF